MSYNLSDHFRCGSEFVEKGHLIKAWQPANGKAEREFVIQVFLNDILIREITVPMHYPNMWGVDAQDVADLENATERLIGSL